MRFDVVTLFPEMFQGPMTLSIVGRARKSGSLELGFVNPRDYSSDRHRTVDDRPFGGGAGMVLMPEPLFKAVESVRRANSKVIFLSPKGRRYTQALAREIASWPHAVLVCGHYEGVDQRFIDQMADIEISIGDYVVTGGELPAMVLIDSVARLLPGVLLKPQASEEESFSVPLLEAPHYTRPRTWRRRKVPKVLLEGDHSKIRRWRLASARKITRRLRPDLLK